MGLAGVGENTAKAKKRFSSDILKIELTGPKQQHLSVVDVPGTILPHSIVKRQVCYDRLLTGLYHSMESISPHPILTFAKSLSDPTEEQTETDLATIRALIHSYVSDRRTIIM